MTSDPDAYSSTPDEFDGRGYLEVRIPDPDYDPEADHCEHHQHDDRCGGHYGECEWDYGADYCTHCECCCTCLSCEYGPRDGMLLTEDQRAAIGGAS